MSSSLGGETVFSRLKTIALALASLVIPASAAPWVTIAGDSGAGIVNPFPNASTARNDFLAVVGAGNVVTFEGLNLGLTNFSLNSTNCASSPSPCSFLSSDVTVNFSITNPGDVAGIRVADIPEYGYNTTVNGGNANRFYRVGQNFGPRFGQNGAPTSLTITFGGSTATNYFAAYITGTQEGLPGTIEVETAGGANYIVPFTRLPGTTGGIQFFALRTDTAFTSLTFRQTGSTDLARDLFGIDDIQFGFTSSQIPEPSTMALMGIGGMLLLVARRKK
jgi:hypothetical protein